MVQSAKPVPPIWCPGCGDFSLLAAVKKASANLKIPTHDLVLVGGIGCSGSSTTSSRSTGSTRSTAASSPRRWA